MNTRRIEGGLAAIQENQVQKHLYRPDQTTGWRRSREQTSPDPPVSVVPGSRLRTRPEPVRLESRLLTSGKTKAEVLAPVPALEPATRRRSNVAPLWLSINCFHVWRCFRLGCLIINLLIVLVECSTPKFYTKLDFQFLKYLVFSPTGILSAYSLDELDMSSWNTRSTDLLGS
jgi:hypothetical protein